MGIITRRRRKFQQYLVELKTFLTDNGVTPCHLFNDTNLLNYLACVPFNNLLHSMKLTKVNIHLSDEEMKFVKFILRFGKIRSHKQNFLLDSPPRFLHYDSPILGRKENPRYEEEMEHYRAKLEEFEHRMASLEKQREELWKSPNAEIFNYVEKELRSSICSRCNGTGWSLPDEPDNNKNKEKDKNKIEEVADIVEIECPWCNGTGSSGYTPRISPDQHQLAETFRAKLENLKDPIFHNFPLKKKPVFIRLTYEGHLFIK
jgi:hypothetical protein